MSAAIYKNTFVAIERNRSKTHPFNLYNPLKCKNGDLKVKDRVCSEAALIIRLKNTTNFKFHKLEMINIRIGKNLKIGMARPCFSCSVALRFFEFKSVYFSNQDGEFEKYS